MKKIFVVFMMLVLSLALAGQGFAVEDTLEAPKVVPWSLAGNPDCKGLVETYGDPGAFWHELKYDLDEDTGETVELTIPDTEYKVTVYLQKIGEDYKILAFESELPVDAVLLKSGKASSKFYVYDGKTGPAPGTTRDKEESSDSGLETPQGISHVSFCYDFELMVEKTADPTFTRTWDWIIEKTSETTAITLPVNGTIDVNYEVVVTGSFVDDYAVSGTIAITNPDPYNDAVIAAVTDEISGTGLVEVDCGEGEDWFPYTLASGATLTCSYSSPLPDTEQRLNTATAVVSEESEVPGGVGTADIIFDGPTEVIDDCVDVTDDPSDFSGKFCAEEGNETYAFEYSMTVGPYEDCGLYEFENTASYVARDTDTSGSSSYIIEVNVPCGGCTLTQGYWKTHTNFDGKKFDEVWLEIGEDGAGEIFSEISEKTYYEVLWTSPAGNAYYTLAHQFIAAKLNGLNGAAVPEDVEDVMGQSETFFAVWDPTTALNKEQKKQVTKWAELLDLYNNGLLEGGPMHCSESESSLTSGDLYIYTAGTAWNRVFLPVVIGR